MRKFKKVIGLVLAMMTVFTMCSCQNGKTAKGEDPNKVPSDPYEINWYMRGTAQSDISSVENAINDYLKDKINATVKITILESGQYNQKMSNMIAAGEYFDLALPQAIRLIMR